MKTRIEIILDKSYRGMKSSLFTGRPEGKKVREALLLNDKDKSNDDFVVYIPEGTTSFNASFFLGLFFESLEYLGSLESFKEKYQISLEKVDERLRPCLEKNLQECYRKAENELNNSTGLD